MKKNLSAIVLMVMMLSISACKKCYYCQNSCSICQNSYYHILVQSDIYGTAYYNLYLDSLKSLGWTCSDTTSDKNFQTCSSSTHTVDNNVTLAGQQGYACTAVPQ